MKNKGFVDRLVTLSEKTIENLLAILFVIIVVIGFIQVTSRVILNSSLIWGEELIRYSGIWLVMFSMAIAFKNREHIAVDFFFVKFPLRIKRAVGVINQLITILVMLLFTVYSIVLLTGTYNTPSPSMRIPMGFIYAGVILGGFLSVMFSIYTMRDVIRDKYDKDKLTQLEEQIEQIEKGKKEA